MNLDRLKKNIGWKVRLLPIPRRPAMNRELPRLEDEWLIEEASVRGITLRNTRTDHKCLLGLDHIHNFMTDPMRDAEGIHRGFLQLRVQVKLYADHVEVEPLRPGQWDSTQEEAPHPRQSRQEHNRKLGRQPLPADKTKLFLDSREVGAFVSPGDFQGSMFSLEHLHPDRSHGSGAAVYELHMFFDDLKHDELENILRVANETFRLASSGSFSIEQNYCAWHGFGAHRFLQEIRERDRRYKENKALEWHHSEDFAFSDAFSRGFLLLSGRQLARTSPTRGDYYGVELTLLFPGLLIDNSPIREFCKAVGQEEPMLVPTPLARDSAWVKRSSNLVHPVALIQDRGWIGGIIVENPYFKKPKAVPKGRDDSDSFVPLSELRHLVCDLRDHYPIGHQPVGFRLGEFETLAIGSRRIFQVRGTWDDCPCKGHPVTAKTEG